MTSQPTVCSYLQSIGDNGRLKRVGSGFFLVHGEFKARFFGFARLLGIAKNKRCSTAMLCDGLRAARAVLLFQL